jgi:hypothetical protein
MTKLYDIPFPSARIASQFDLELIQYVVVNAFVHAPFDQDIFMRMPRGYEKKGTILNAN